MVDPNQIAIQALRQAIALAPDNIELVFHLAQTLNSLLRFEESIQVYKEALERFPGQRGLQLGLAESYWRQGKSSHALAILETLLTDSHPTAETYLLHCRVLQAEGNVVGATASYREAIDLSPELADKELESLLGFQRFGTDEDESQEPARLTWEDQEESDVADSVAFERPSITFADVGGMTEVKDDIRIKIIYPLQHPDIYAAYGKKAGGGILMYGPPGCGKTLLARATAGEVKSNFMSIGINEVLDMWMGNSEKNLHALFERARRHRPCIMFFDEVDALGASRSDMRKTGGRHLINQFLSELDGVQANNEGLLFLAATNAPWHLDSAFKRPGRFDRVIFVPPPDEEARTEIVTLHLKGKPVDRIDYRKVAKATQQFSGADLNAVVDFAVEGKLKEALKTGRPTPITTHDLLAAAKSRRPSTSEWFASARNHALYANEGGEYDAVLQYLGMKK
jgi:SpoVK/Ycf46/Vps4 family AAA+-type ATPase